MKRITQFDGLYGDFLARPDGEYLFSELLETRSRTFDWVVQPHIHPRLFQVFYIETGEVVFQGPVQTQRLQGPCVLLIPPAALHGFTYSSDVTGRILTLSDSLVEALFTPSSGLASLLHQVWYVTTFELPYSAAFVLELVKQIDAELFADMPEKRTMLQAYLHQLFIVLHRLINQNKSDQAAPHTQAIVHFRQFQNQLRQATAASTVVEIASELAITPVHLNRVCRIVANKSASQLVQEHITNEARKYLTYTSYSVSEIAYLLDFEYPNYFAKFFRKHTGVSPTAFREQHAGGS